MALVITERANPQNCQLPQLVVTNLGNTNVEFILKLSGNRFKYLSLALERQIFR
jgi:hypothetical protein